MSQSHVLQQHIEQLKEIRSILHALKNMAYMEIHKLTKNRQTQRLIVQHIETVAADFLKFNPGVPILKPGHPTVIIVIGSERGFCGNFNKSLIDQLLSISPDIVIAVGSRLCSSLHHTQIQYSELMGANSFEEISQILENLGNVISKLQDQHQVFSLSVLFHQDEHLETSLQSLIPPFNNVPAQHTIHTIEPLLNLEPPQFLLELVEHYLLSSLQDILYASLTSENIHRIQHLDNAVRHLDQTTEKIHKKSQIFRQEEITEEIEVILLNVENQSI